MGWHIARREPGETWRANQCWWLWICGRHESSLQSCRAYAITRLLRPEPIGPKLFILGEPVLKTASFACFALFISVYFGLRKREAFVSANCCRGGSFTQCMMLKKNATELRQFKPSLATSMDSWMVLELFDLQFRRCCTSSRSKANRSTLEAIFDFHSLWRTAEALDLQEQSMRPRVLTPRVTIGGLQRTASSLSCDEWPVK